MSARPLHAPAPAAAPAPAPPGRRARTAPARAAPAAALTARSLQELKSLRQQLAERRAQAEREVAEREAAARRAQAERHLFARAVGAVQPLRHHGKVLLPAAPPAAPLPRQRQADERAVLREALSDELDPGTLLDSDETLGFARPGVGPDVLRRLRRGEWTIQRQLDLHGLRTDAAREALGTFVREAHRAGLRCVRIIHGKGLGSPGGAPVLKGRVPRWLIQKSEVMAFVQARPTQGGDGAVVALLRPARHEA